MIRVLTIGVLLSVLAVGPAHASVEAPSRPSDLVAMRFFKTPGNAVYCYLAQSLAPEVPMLGCWTPNDGFKADVSHWRGVRADYSRARIFKGYEPSGYRVLSFGRTFRWRCLEVDSMFAERCSTQRGTVVFTCTSRSSGLTCRNQKGRGFWLGRYRGYKVY